MTAFMDLQITRYDLPPVPEPSRGSDEVSEIEVCATLRLGEILAEVVRFIYWDPRDSKPLETTYEVQVHGLDNGAGVADFVVDRPTSLLDLAAVCTKAAEILEEVQ